MKVIALCLLLTTFTWTAPLEAADDWTLEMAAGILAAKGYIPETRWDMRLLDIWGPLPADYPEGPELTDVTIWRWNDHNPLTGTGIISLRERATFTTRTLIVQMTPDGRIMSVLPIVSFSFTASDIKKVEPPPDEPPKKFDPVKGWGWAPTNPQLANFYLCASVGCGGAMLVTFLFGPIVGTGGFAIGCTGSLMGCGLKGLIYGF